MNRADTFVILEALRAFGQPLSNDDLTVQAWAHALDADMPAAWARDFLAHHYANASSDLRVADFNHAWREQKERDYWTQIQQQPRAISQEPEAKPMPEYVRQQWERIRSRGGE